MSHEYRACISHAPDARRMSTRRPSRVVVSGPDRSMPIFLNRSARTLFPIMSFSHMRSQASSIEVERAAARKIELGNSSWETRQLANY